MMEPRPQQILRWTKRCRLYIEDVQALVNVLDSGAGDVEISLPGYGTKDGAAALLTHGPSALYQIEISRHNPTYVTINLSPSQGYIFGISDDAATVGTVAKAEEIIRRQERRASLIAFSYVTALTLFAMWMVFFVFYYVATLSHHWSPTTKVILFSPLLFLYLHLFVTYWIRRNRHTIVVCARRRDAPNFWQRNKDRIVVGSITAVVGTVLGALLVKLLG